MKIGIAMTLALAFCADVEATDCQKSAVKQQAQVQQFQSFPIQSFVQTHSFALPQVQTVIVPQVQSVVVPQVQTFLQTQSFVVPQVLSINSFSTQQQFRQNLRSNFSNRFGRRVVRQRSVTRCDRR